jgi:hypothetical protein
MMKIDNWEVSLASSGTFKLWIIRGEGIDDAARRERVPLKREAEDGQKWKVLALPR